MTPALNKPLVLAVDSALNGCAVALLDTQDNRLLASISRQMSSGQAEHLVPMIEQTLKDGGAQYSDIGLIAVVNGPGAFTGIRIGIAAAKALALALNTPVVGVGTFDAVLKSALQSEENRGYDRVSVILETKRTDFYVQAYEGKGAVLTPGTCASAQNIKDSLSEKKTLLIGDGVERLLSEWEDAPSSVVMRRSALADPMIVAEIGKDLFLKEKISTDIQPVYLRAPDVSIPKISKRQQK